MKLLSFIEKKDNAVQKIGAMHNGNILDFTQINVPKTMIDFIEMGDQGLDIANDYLESDITGIDPSETIIKAPIPRPNKILAVGLNYKEHVDEAKDVAEHHSSQVELQEQFLPSHQQ